MDELVPEFIDAIPVDFMNGEPLRHNSETRRIYGVGRDFLDNKGEIDPERRGPFRDFKDPMVELGPTLESDLE